MHEQCIALNILDEMLSRDQHGLEGYDSSDGLIMNLHRCVRITIPLFYSIPLAMSETGVLKDPTFQSLTRSASKYKVKRAVQNSPGGLSFTS